MPEIPWDWVSDETRSVEGPHVARSVRQWLLDVLDQARTSPWDGQPRPMVICESRGVRAALRVRATAGRYGALVTSTNGQAGGYLHTDLAPLLVPGSPVAYFGDWNPAGSHIERNTRRVLERAAGELAWQRLAVTPQQAEGAGLPPKPGTDRRYRDGNPNDSYDAEALGQAALTRLLAVWLDKQLPVPLAEIIGREQAEREQLRALSNGGEL